MGLGRFEWLYCYACLDSGERWASVLKLLWHMCHVILLHAMSSLCTHQLCTWQHHLFVLLGIVVVINMHALVGPLLMSHHVVHRR